MTPSGVLSPTRLLSLPAPLRRRAEIKALTYAVLTRNGALDLLEETDQRSIRAAREFLLRWETR